MEKRDQAASLAEDIRRTVMACQRMHMHTMSSTRTALTGTTLHISEPVLCRQSAYVVSAAESNPGPCYAIARAPPSSAACQSSSGQRPSGRYFTIELRSQNFNEHNGMPLYQ